MTEKIPVGISSCLLGENVRYDGGHKRDNSIKLTLGQFFEFKRFCPEVESGMGVPRPPIQLRDTEQGVRCVDIRDHNIDVTEKLAQCAKEQNRWLQGLCGYILKRNSPSCGMEKVNVFKKDDTTRMGTGIFAQYLKDHFPLLPLEEEGRLGDPKLRENFIQRIFVMHRWHVLLKQPLTTLKLTEFHRQHQLIAMSHEQGLAKVAGRIAASAYKHNIEQVSDEYIKVLMASLKVIATRCNHIKVLQHIQGLLKKNLSDADKQELIEVIESFCLGKVPLIVPITLLKHHFYKQPDAFIESSWYMNPSPGELSLLNGSLT